MIKANVNRRRHHNIYREVFIRYARMRGYRPLRCDGEKPTHAICLSDATIVFVADKYGQEPWMSLVPNDKAETSARSDDSSPAPCSATKHESMYRDGWKNCWDCDEELVPSFDLPNDQIGRSVTQEKDDDIR